MRTSRLSVLMARLQSFYHLRGNRGPPGNRILPGGPRMHGVEKIFSNAIIGSETLLGHSDRWSYRHQCRLFLYLS